MLARSRLRLVAAWHSPLVLCIAMAVRAPGLVADAGLPGSESPPAPAALTAAAEKRAEAMARVATGALSEDADPDECLRHYQRALNLDPSSAALARDVAGMLLQRGDIPGALAALKDALKQDPDSASLALRIAGIYAVSLRKLEPAERYAKTALESAPDLIEPYQLLYSIHRASGRPEAAAKLLRQAGARRNDDPEFWAGLGDLWMRQLVMEGKLRDTDAAAEGLARYRRAAELGQQDAAVLLRALNFFVLGGHLEDAVSTARRLLVLQPSDTASREKLALALASLGRDDEALVELEAVTADNPASIVAYRAHGEILLKRGDTAGALAKFEKALALNDEDPRLYIEIAELCMNSGDPERAIRWIGEAKAKYGRLPELAFYEGRLLGRMERWREALNAFNLAAELAAQNEPSFLTADFHFQHGVVAERAGEHEQAAGHFQACLDRDADHAAALNYLGYMWAERGENLPEAENLVRRALQSEPDNPAFLDSLGWVLFQQGRYHEALAPLERASASATQPDATIEEHLGDTLERLGRVNEAVKAWERALALEGGSAQLPAKLQSSRGSLGLPAGEARTAKP